MRIVIYNFEKVTDGMQHYGRRLSNGETLLERQLRLLMELGVREIAIAGDQALYEYAGACVKERRDMKKLSISKFMPELSFDEDDRVLLIESNLLFTAEILKDMYQTEEKCQILAEFRTPENYRELTVRLDMDRVVEIADGLEGLDVCAVYPMIAINFTVLEELDREEIQKSFVFDGNEAFLRSLISTFADKTKGFLMFEESGHMCRAAQSIQNVFTDEIHTSDICQRTDIKGCGSSVQIQEILKKEEAQKILLIHDKAYAKMPLQMLFEIQGVQCDTVEYKKKLDLESIISKKEPDFLIAVGDSGLLNHVDAVRHAMFMEQGEYPELKLMAVPDFLCMDYDVMADYYVMDGNLVCTCREEIPNTFLNVMLYCAYGILLDGHMTEQNVDDVRSIFNYISNARNTFWKQKPYAYQRLLEACFVWSRNTYHSNKVMDAWIEKMAERLDCDKCHLINLVIPELTRTFFEKLEGVEDAVFDDRLKKSVGNAAGIHIEKRGQLEERKAYVQILLENGIKPLNTDAKIEKISDSFLDAYAKEELPTFLTKKDLTGILTRSLVFAKQVEKEIAEAADSEKPLVFKKPKEEPTLKRKIINRLKQIQVVKDLNILIRKKGRFKLYQLVYPVNKKWVLFEAYGGTDNGYSCNTKAIYEAMLQDPDYFDYKFIWAFIHPNKFRFLKQNPNTVIVKRGSKRYIKFCARAGYIFTNTGMPKYIKPNRHQEMVYTWHGKPLKRIGCSFKGESEGKRNKKQLIHDYTASGKRLSKLLSPAPIFTDIMADAYNLSPAKRKTAMLETGYPRNDYLFKYTQEDVLKMKMNLQIPLDKKVILYAPTWRPFKWIGGKKFEHTAVLDLEKLKEQFGDDYVFLCRLHHLERDSMQFDQYPGFLYDVSMVADVNDLYIISDCLISDYSGTVFDFANLRRPIVLFMYDKEQYVGGANGLNFDLDFLPGPIVETQEEMVNAVKDQMEHFVYEGKYKKFNEACNCLDGADCAIRTAKQIVAVNPEVTKKQEAQIKINIIRRNTKLTLQGWSHKLPFLRDENTRRIASYHNKYKGERCFLIGNGPSLRLADLNMLKDEYCFGCNMIYKVFERTDWRPTFLCASDRVVARAASEQLQDSPESTLWVSKTAYDLMPYKGDNLICVSNLRKEKYYVHGNMTEYYVPSIATVMTFMIELAMYMGFSEIYLLGVDFSIGRNQNDHFMNSYRDNNMTELEHKKMRNMFRGEDIGVHEAQVRLEGRALYAYEKLEEYAKKHGYHVYNATRGGYLEVFERADLDEVLK